MPISRHRFDIESGLLFDWLLLSLEGVSEEVPTCSDQCTHHKSKVLVRLENEISAHREGQLSQVSCLEPL